MPDLGRASKVCSSFKVRTINNMHLVGVLHALNSLELQLTFFECQVQCSVRDVEQGHKGIQIVALVANLVPLLGVHSLWSALTVWIQVCGKGLNLLDSCLSSYFDLCFCTPNNWFHQQCNLCKSFEILWPTVSVSRPWQIYARGSRKACGHYRGSFLGWDCCGFSFELLLKLIICLIYCCCLQLMMIFIKIPLEGFNSWWSFFPL